MQKDIIETVLILVTFFIATLVIAMYRNFDKILEIIKIWGIKRIEKNTNHHV